MNADKRGKRKYKRHKHKFIMELKHNQITGKIIDAFFQVYNKMGYGFQEKVYQNSIDFIGNNFWRYNFRSRRLR